MNSDLNDVFEWGQMNEDISSNEYLKLQLDKFAISTDMQIQNKLTSDLMLRYAEMSNMLEKNNKLLTKYNEQLEDMVDEKVKDISDLQMATIYSLVKLSESRDDDTGAHIIRTSTLCKVLAELLKGKQMYKQIIDDDFVENIFKASPLHDIGKVGIPDRILLKPGKLTYDEFEIMKTHVTIGYNTLKEVRDKFPNSLFLEMGMDIVKYHHEKWDGSGYPNGVSGRDISLPGRIIAIIDVYDALRSKRVYKEAYTHEESCSILKKGSGKHFDPFIVDVFLEYNETIKDIHYKLG
ncbi:MAG: HD domain-containing protein [Tissierellia bacterium]|nr:HD domain-containing protein [Tissierellia bacterium]MDD4726896.1 HD domain-containing protein [Tissierellia bacterium]